MTQEINPYSLPEPMRIHPEALADLQDGTVVLLRNDEPDMGEAGSVSMERLEGQWWLSGMTRSLTRDEVDRIVGPSARPVTLWVLPLP